VYADSGATHTTKGYENMMTALVENDVSYAELAQGDSWNLGDARVEVLMAEDGKTSNEKSVVLSVTHGEVSFLLPGDREDLKDLNVTIFVVPHHGSGGVRLEAVHPEVAIISVGMNNRYGHPASATLSFLKDLGAEIYRTDLDGTVTVVSDGEGYTITCSKALVTEYEDDSAPGSEIDSKDEICDCSGDLLNCGDFSSRNDAQTCYDYCLALGKGDVHRLDLNNDGFACDSLRSH
jgi:beta-lactamase superfamily II metal-dependent hydrolase